MMADDGGEQGAIRPAQRFDFSVDFGGGIVARFEQVSGLAIAPKAGESHAGTTPDFNSLKLPPLRKPSYVTLNRGVLPCDSPLWDWIRQSGVNRIKRRDLTISLLDNTGAPAKVWHLANAFSTGFRCSRLEIASDSMAVETIELAHDRPVIAPG